MSDNNNYGSNPCNANYPAVQVQLKPNWWLLVLTILAHVIVAVETFYGPQYVVGLSRFKNHLAEVVFAQPDFSYWVTNRRELGFVFGIESIRDAAFNRESISTLKGVINAARDYCIRCPGPIQFTPGDNSDYKSIGALLARYHVHKMQRQSELAQDDNKEEKKESDDNQDDEKEDGEEDDNKQNDDNNENSDDNKEDVDDSNVVVIPVGTESIVINGNVIDIQEITEMMGRNNME
eukprot:395742_1